MSLLPSTRRNHPPTPQQQARRVREIQAYLAFGTALAALLGAGLVGALIGCLIQAL